MVQSNCHFSNRVMRWVKWLCLQLQSIYLSNMAMTRLDNHLPQPLQPPVSGRIKISTHLYARGCWAPSHETPLGTLGEHPTPRWMASNSSENSSCPSRWGDHLCQPEREIKSMIPYEPHIILADETCSKAHSVRLSYSALRLLCLKL